MTGRQDSKRQEGYSGTPLAKKLGIKEGSRLLLFHVPDHYFSLFSHFPEGVQLNIRTAVDCIHYFTTEEKQLSTDILLLKSSIAQNGAIWISWPKKASKITTDMTEDTIRKIALNHGLVDVKVCAVDATWSALKLVIPVKDRR